MAAANYDGAAGSTVGADIKLDALLSTSAARAAVVEFLVSVDRHEFDEAVFCQGKPCIPCLTPGLIARFVLMAEPIID